MCALLDMPLILFTNCQVVFLSGNVNHAKEFQKAHFIISFMDRK